MVIFASRMSARVGPGYGFGFGVCLKVVFDRVRAFGNVKIEFQRPPRFPPMRTKCDQNQPKSPEIQISMKNWQFLGVLAGDGGDLGAT